MKKIFLASLTILLYCSISYSQIKVDSQGRVGVESVTDAWHAVGVGGTFTIPLANTTIDDDEIITGCKILVENVTIENSSKLTLNYTNSVIINKEFEVEAGSELEVY